MLLLSPFGGVLADRMDRGRLLAMTWGGTGAIFAVLSLLILLGHIQVWHLAVAAFLNGVLFAFNLPARFALVSQVVPPERLTNAMALISLSFKLNGVLFPLVGGMFIDVAGTGGTYVTIAVLYWISAIVAMLIKAPKEDTIRQKKGVFNDIGEGFKAVRKDKVLLWLLGLNLVGTSLGQPYMVLLPDFAADTLHIPATGLGLLMAVVGLGGVAGNLIVASLKERAPLGKWMLAMSAASGAGLVWLAFSSTLPSSLAALFFLGITGLPFFTVTQVLVQKLAPPEVRGRVMSLYMLTWGVMPIGIIASTKLADAVGIVWPLLLSGSLLVVITIATVLVKPSLLRLPYRKPEAPVKTDADIPGPPIATPTPFG
ncbi:MAG: MFS transporter, partial [Chloroflexota bacterium]